MVAPPNQARLSLIDATVRALKTAGIWSRLDLFYMTGAHDAQTAKLNWVQSAYNLVEVNAPTFTVDRGYASNGTTSYLNTTFQPGVTAGSKFARDDCSLSTWSLDNGDPSGAACGNNSLRILPRSSGNMITRCSDLTAVTVAVASSTGHSAISRSANTGYSRYRDGAALADAVVASTVPSSVDIYLCCLNGSGTPTSFCTQRQAMLTCGQSLTAGQIAALYSIGLSYLNGIGAI